MDNKSTSADKDLVVIDGTVFDITNRGVLDFSLDDPSDIEEGADPEDAVPGVQPH
jgi:hypothetical protein